MSFSAGLRSLLPAAELAEADYQAAFRAIAEWLLHAVTWQIGGAPHRITEIEFYWDGPGHPDSFTHGDPLQREFARWYFHRSAGEYRGGTYKGLDIACGRADTAAGILIRGAAPLGEGALLDGPCLCVDHVLARTGHRTVRSLAESFDGAVDAVEGSPLGLSVEAMPRVGRVFESARVGLTLRRGVPAERARYLARPYRFLSEPARIKKGRLHVVVGMHRLGVPAREIAALTGSSVAQVEKYVAAHTAGQGRELGEFIEDLGAEDTCRLLGACERYMARDGGERPR